MFVCRQRAVYMVNYTENHIHFPEGYKRVNAGTAKVIVTFTMDESREIENAYTSTPFTKRFDDIAENAIMKSPRLLPAIKYQRNVKQVLLQLVNIQHSNY